MRKQNGRKVSFARGIFWGVAFWVICVLALFNWSYYGDRIINTFDSSVVWAKDLFAVSKPAPPRVVNPQFFIDVWKLRDDVAELESQVVSGDEGDSCYSEGGEEDEVSEVPPPTQQVIEQRKAEQNKQAEAERQCVDEATKRYRAYEQARKTFNQKWVPLLTKAIENGDLVAEVIMRQCSTTNLLDRSQIESTCEALNSERRAFAANRLREIGFVPAFDWDYEYHSRRVAPANQAKEMEKYHLTLEQLRQKEIRDVQELVLEQFKHGVLGYFGRWQSDLAVTNASNGDNIDRYALLVHASQTIPRAFTFSPPLPGEWATASLSELRLARTPETPKALTWGPELFSHYDRKPTVTGGPPYRFLVTTSTKKRRILQANEAASYFSDAIGDVISRSEAYIDQSLQQDPRWSVFLLRRMGYHEWVPEKTQSDTNKLAPEWQGKWELERTFVDYRAAGDGPEAVGKARVASIDNASEPKMRGMEITADGEHTTINFHNGSNTDPLKDGSCELRYSGGSTYIPKLLSIDGHDSPREQDWEHSMFGDLEPNCTGTGYISGAGSSSNFGQCGGSAKKNGAVFAPLDPAKSYKQVLVLCAEGETLDSYTMRFLLMEGDRLLEFAALTPENSSFYVRHYRRVVSNPN